MELKAGRLPIGKEITFSHSPLTKKEQCTQAFVPNTMWS